MQFSTTQLAGRRAIITGGASGIGEATAIAVAAAGAEVVVTDVDEAGAARVAEAIGAAPAVLDVSDPTAWDRIVTSFGPFDIAFLNAGISTFAGRDHPDGLALDDLTDADYRRIMSINVDGVVFGVRAVMPGMTAAGVGDVVVTASIAGLHPIAQDPIYGLTKHAVIGLVRSLAAGIEQNPNAPDVCFSAVCPGFADTKIVSDSARIMLDSLNIELLQPSQIAELVIRALDERVQGAQWVIWPGIEPGVYEWRSAIG